MNHFEVENCLRSIEILVDTREQDTERARERYNRFPASMSDRHCLMGIMLIISSCRMEAVFWNIPRMRWQHRSSWNGR